jgi:hypothetical protein
VADAGAEGPLERDRVNSIESDRCLAKGVKAEKVARYERRHIRETTDCGEHRECLSAFVRRHFGTVGNSNGGISYPREDHHLSRRVIPPLGAQLLYAGTAPASPPLSS